MTEDSRTHADRAERLAALRAEHTKSYASAADETWDRDPICRADEHSWPCDTAVALDLAEESLAAATTMRADVHHHVNPAIGWLRWYFHRATEGVDPLAVPGTPDGQIDVRGLPESIPLPVGTFVATVRQMQAATDAADAALGEEPMRVQIERVQAQITGQDTPS